MDAGDFFKHSLRAAIGMGRRAVLLVGPQARNLGRLPDTVFVADYAPYSDLLPHAAATVHQAGIGTTAQALRAGRPMLAVPFSHDQPDNAERVSNLGVARILYRNSYTAERAQAALCELLSGPYANRAAEVGREIRTEDGVGTACAMLEQLAADV
jgi:UDP:flavonoid glycosyltransferase YjiC (YdhE family)